MDPKESTREPISDSIILTEINDETPEEELITILAQEPPIYFEEGEFRRDYPEIYSECDYDKFRIVLISPKEDSSEEFTIIFNPKARVYNRNSGNYTDERVPLLVIENKWHTNTLIYSQGLGENKVFLENDRKLLTLEEGTIEINSKLQKAYFGLYKAKAYALLRNSQHQKTLIRDNNFNFKWDRKNILSTESIDMMLEIIKSLLSRSSEREDIINRSNIKYKD